MGEDFHEKEQKSNWCSNMINLINGTPRYPYQLPAISNRVVDIKELQPLVAVAMALGSSNNAVRSPSARIRRLKYRLHWINAGLRGDGQVKDPQSERQHIIKWPSVCVMVEITRWEQTDLLVSIYRVRGCTQIDYPLVQGNVHSLASNAFLKK